MLASLKEKLPERAVRALAAACHRSPMLSRLVVGTARRLAPRHRLGAVAVVIDATGCILVAQHTFRSGRWALPGGWVHHDEDPADAVVRELWEELGLLVDPLAVVACETHAVGTRRARVLTTSGVTVVYSCTPSRREERPALRCSAELSEAVWMDVPTALERLSPFEARGVREAIARSVSAPPPQDPARAHRPAPDRA